MRQPVQELIERYQNNLYAIAFNICKNQADAEDVVQDTLIQYYTTSKDFEDEQHIRARNCAERVWHTNLSSCYIGCAGYRKRSVRHL